MHVSTARIRLAIPRSMLLGWVAIPLLLWGRVIGSQPLLLLLWRLLIAQACWRLSVLGSCEGEEVSMSVSDYLPVSAIISDSFDPSSPTLSSLASSPYYSDSISTEPPKKQPLIPPPPPPPPPPDDLSLLYWSSPPRLIPLLVPFSGMLIRLMGHFGIF